MTPAEAKAGRCAFFNNRYGVRRLCQTENPQLWPRSPIYNADVVTCPSCLEMLARRAEYWLGGDSALDVPFEP